MATAKDTRVFTFNDACRLIPQVRDYTRDAIEKLTAIQMAIEEDDENEESAHEELQQSAAELLERWAQNIRSLGADVKGPWLVDFDSGAGYYCWKWPEEALEFFHGYEEGFAGRIRIQ
jgi:hypothetical protein